jgi:hypothetical protein
MNERLLTYSFSPFDPNDAAALGDLCLYFMVPFSATLVYASAAPWDDDADLTMDLHDDGVAIITALACDDKEAPGEWISTHAGGTETPVAIAAGSEMTVDFNAAAIANRVDVVFQFLTGESWG